MPPLSRLVPHCRPTFAVEALLTSSAGTTRQLFTFARSCRGYCLGAAKADLCFTYRRGRTLPQRYVSLPPSNRTRPPMRGRYGSNFVGDTAGPGTPHVTARQLRAHLVAAAIPMMGFGFMDSTVMIHASNAIDCTLGVFFGLSTLTAAAFGHVVSNAGGVVFGGAVERLAQRAGLPSPGFTAAQRALPIVRRMSLLGSFFGVILGCTIGLVNLLLIDTERSSILKTEALADDENDFSIQVEASNAKRPDATILTVRGCPDVDGLLAAMTASLTVRGCSVVEVHATPCQSGADDNFVSTFVVRARGTSKKQQVDDGELDGLAQALLAATKEPLSAHSLKAQVQELTRKKRKLLDRTHRLEELLEDTQITVVSPSSTGKSL